MSVRGQAALSILGLSLWLVAKALELVTGITFPGTLLLVVAVMVPLFAALSLDALARFGTGAPRPDLMALAMQGTGAVGFAVGADLGIVPLAMVTGVVFAAGAVKFSIGIMKAAPKTSVVTDDPLTKGDDACFKQLVFAHRFLPLGAILLAAVPWIGLMDQGLATRLLVAAQHILVIGYGLLATYGTSHLWVPRFSGVPAIAAGAIKGELHSTLLGLTGLVLGFLTGITGIMAGLGFFVFVGFFTFMGVLGANMMKNKSKTHRVTPEFVYIPWTFTAIFWLISAVLMGLFLNVVPDVFADRYGDLRHLHIAAGMLGGFIQLAIGMLTRILPTAADAAPPRFQGRQRGAFFAFNGGLAWWLWAGFAGSPYEAVGLGLMALALLLIAPLAKLIPAGRSAPA